MGTSRIRPVHLTVSPSEMCSYSPRITAPTESRSRLSARPNVFFGNSSISPAITSDSPWIRQMPSEIETTVPSVRTVAPGSRFWILLLISSLISEGFNCMVSSHRPAEPRGAGRLPRELRPQLVGHRLQLRPHGRVDHGIAHRDPRAPDELGIDVDHGLDLLAEALLERRLELRDLLVRERESAVDPRRGHAIDVVLALVEQHRNLRQQPHTLAFDQHADETATFGIELVTADRKE